MKKQKFANNLKFGILLVGISILLFACQKEDVFEITPKTLTSQKTPFTEHTFQEVLLEDDFKEIIVDSKIKKFFNEKEQSNLSKSNTSPSGFTVVKGTVNKVESENYISYTFLIRRIEQKHAVFENLILEKRKGKINALLIKYQPSQEYLNSKNKSFSGKLSIQKIDYNSAWLSKEISPDCYWVETWTRRDCTVHGFNGIYQEECDNYGKDDYTYSSTYSCTSDTGTSFDSDPTQTPISTEGGGNSPTVTTSPVYETAESDIGISIKRISGVLDLTTDERNWLSSQSEETILFYENYLETNLSVEAENWVAGQIELETLFQDSKRNWKAETGNIKNNPHLKYTHKDKEDIYHTYYKMTDGSQILAAGFEKRISKAGDIIDKYRREADLINDVYYYIKIPGEKWAEMLFDPNNLGDQLKTLFKLAAIDLGTNLGRYALPIEDIKILIDGKDFDGQDVSRWKAAGFLLLTVVPGSKGLKVAGKIADATVVVIKLGGGTFVIDTVKYGLKVVTDNNIIKFLSQTGDEIARVVDKVMTLKHIGFGGDIATTINKTTTLIGKWDNQLEKIWNSGLALQGKNIGGINILGEVTGTVAEKWAKNKQWLNNAIARSDVIRVTADPTKAINLLFTNPTNINFNSYNDVVLYMKSFSETSQKFINLGYFGKEIYTLINRYYIYDPILKIFKP